MHGTPDPQWLDERQQGDWRAYLRTSRLLETALDRDLQRHGIGLSEYEILSMLSEADGRHLRMSALADLVVQSRSRLTHTAGRLERRGWVERRATPGDRRGVDLVLTADGLEALRALAPVHVRSVRQHLVDHLDEEQFVAMGEAMRAIGHGIRGECDGRDQDKGADAL